MIGFIIVLLLLASLMLISITQIHDNEQRLTQVTHELADVSNAFSMRDAANNRALLLYRLSQTEDDILRFTLYDDFGNYGIKFLESYKTIKQNLHYNKDKELFTLADNAIQLGGNTQAEVESTLGRGSKFSFDISTGTISDDNLVYSLDHISSQADSSKINPTQKLFGQVLLTEITIVDNGEQAVKICETRKFDLVLMDMQMPVMDGIEATEKIRLIDKKTPIVSLTANAMKSDFERCIDAGANEFITKPIDYQC